MNNHKNIAVKLKVKTCLCSLFPAPYSLFPVPYSLFPTPYSLLPHPIQI
ncbi:hypothetical protein [Moorena sp. SIO4G3]|nr:hypothetical protein [Moorena sp. SIO4G3]NEO77659.1 hypothetical protein [Moorena sp. SIO4G3]